MIDINLLTAKDFIAVRAGLISALGNDANRAVVLTRIHFRADSRWRESLERDDQWWWRATHQTIADETGLSVKQVERCVKWLVDNGFLIAAKHRVEGPYDQTRSYRVHLLESGDDIPESGNVDSPESGNVPSIQNIKTFKLADGERTEVEIDHVFELFWDVYPRHVAKVKARAAFLKALKSTRAAAIIDGAKAYRKTVVDKPAEFIAHPTSWLNGERWTDEHGPTEGTGIDAIRRL